MGWCSGTVIFDDVLDYVLNSELPEDKQAKIVKVLMDSLESEDWDCQSDSKHYEHPIVQAVIKELHPDWEEDDWELVE